MGNSLLDIIVFGRNAGQQAAKKAAATQLKEMTFSHVAKYEAELANAGIDSDAVSPKLLPAYARGARLSDQNKWSNVS